MEEHKKHIRGLSQPCSNCLPPSPIRSPRDCSISKQVKRKFVGGELTMGDGNDDLVSIFITVYGNDLPPAAVPVVDSGPSRPVQIQVVWELVSMGVYHVHERVWEEGLSSHVPDPRHIRPCSGAKPGIVVHFGHDQRLGCVFFFLLGRLDDRQVSSIGTLFCGEDLNSRKLRPQLQAIFSLLNRKVSVLFIHRLCPVHRHVRLHSIPFKARPAPPTCMSSTLQLHVVYAHATRDYSICRRASETARAYRY